LRTAFTLGIITVIVITSLPAGEGLKFGFAIIVCLRRRDMGLNTRFELEKDAATFDISVWTFEFQCCPSDGEDGDLFRHVRSISSSSLCGPR